MTPKHPIPPVAAKHPHTSTIHGDTRTDDYHWLRDKGTPAVTAYLEAENAYAADVLAHTRELQQTLYTELLGRIQQTDLSVPVRERDYYYYYRTEEGKQYPIAARKHGSLDADEQIILDLNEFGAEHAFVGLGALALSGDDHKLAYGLDTTGFREYSLRIKDLRTGEHSAETVSNVSSIAWASDHQTLFYTVKDHAKRPYRVYRHCLGTPIADDALVYEERDERFRVSVHQSRSSQYVFVNVSSHTASEIWYLRADRPTDQLQVIASRSDAHEYRVEHRGDRFYILTNDQGRNFRLVETPVTSPQPNNWQQIIAHRDDVMLSSLRVFNDHYVLHERQYGLPHIRVTAFGTGASHRIVVPEPVYGLSAGRNPDFHATHYRYVYQSLSTPESVFDYHIADRRAELKKETEVLGGYDRTAYVTERLSATAADGASIPLSIIYKRGTPRDGSTPTLLVGYGSYGFSYPVSFSHERVSLLDRGVAFALAHIRGGGEMGKAWHDQGRMFHKQNSFTDFITAAEHLIANGYTRSDRLAIQGGSAGGLLMGAVANMRPDRFKAVISRVPFVDVLNTMLDEDMPLTVGEFEEWGNPKIEQQYAYIKSYCPYTNIARQDYPAMLVRTSLNDSQVMYWEPAKYVAKLRTHKTDQNPLVFQTNMAGGHGGSSGRYDKLRETALDYAFVLWQLGVHLQER